MCDILMRTAGLVFMWWIGFPTTSWAQHVLHTKEEKTAYEAQYQPRRAHAPAAPLLAPSAGLLIELDPSFSVVQFDGVGGNGEASRNDPLQRNDDDISLAIDLPFGFDLYGAAYTKVYVNNNGNITFGGPFVEFTPEGFPFSGVAMIAPFWADVDTRNEASGVAWQKIEANRMTVIWDGVGYYSSHANRLNRFEVIISDGTDPLLGSGNNVCFSYDFMDWTTGDASGGTGGFGGTPATAGANAGNGTNFFQLGRFGHAGDDYDGPGRTTDGVDYLDGQLFCFDTASSVANIPPVPEGFPQSRQYEVDVGSTLREVVSFLSPELGQTTTIEVDAGGLANFRVDSNTPGNPAQVTFTFTPDVSQVGNHTVIFTATDDGNPPLSTKVEVTFVTSITNVPPVPEGFPQSRQYEVNVGSTLREVVRFLSPELGQTTTIEVDAGGLANFRVDSNTPGNPAQIAFTFTPDVSQVGDHTVVFTATDDGNPPLSTKVEVALVIVLRDRELVVRPNPFTPNGDGFNDQVRFDFSKFGLAQWQLQILSFEGRLVRVITEAEGFTLNWDGRSETGEEQPPGVYLYLIEDGAVVVASGSIILAR